MIYRFDRSGQTFWSPRVGVLISKTRRRTARVSIIHSRSVMTHIAYVQLYILCMRPKPNWFRVNWLLALSRFHRITPLPPRHPYTRRDDGRGPTRPVTTTRTRRYWVILITPPTPPPLPNVSRVYERAADRSRMCSLRRRPVRAGRRTDGNHILLRRARSPVW